MFNELEILILRSYFNEVKTYLEDAKELTDEQDHDRKMLDFYEVLVSIKALTDFVSELMESKESEQEC